MTKHQGIFQTPKSDNIFWSFCISIRNALVWPGHDILKVVACENCVSRSHIFKSKAILWRTPPPLFLWDNLFLIHPHPLVASVRTTELKSTCWAMARILQYSASAEAECVGAATFTSHASPVKVSEPLRKHASRFYRKRTEIFGSENSSTTCWH